MRRFLFLFLTLTVLAAAPGVGAAAPSEVRLRDLGRFEGWRDNNLVGYGIVIGLSGTGDSPRNAASRQALQNVLGKLGSSIPLDQIQSRNVAAVVVTAVLPPSGNVGDRIDVTVSSIGDARSLAGGTLLMTTLQGPDRQTYGLAQGPLLVGGYRFDSDLNREQRNLPTSGTIAHGGTIEVAVKSSLLVNPESLTFILREPSFTTAVRVADAVNLRFGGGVAQVRDADEVAIDTRAANGDVFRLIAMIEEMGVNPARSGRIVVNERTGTIVGGGDVQISSVVISQGDIRVSVTSERSASQPEYYLGGDDLAGGLIVTNTKLAVNDRPGSAVVRLPNTTVADLVEALRKANVDTRGIISVLQAIQAAGALHADLIVQ